MTGQTGQQRGNSLRCEPSRGSLCAVRHRFVRFLLLFVALWLPVQTMAAMSMPLCRHAQEHAMAGAVVEQSAAAEHCHEVATPDQTAHSGACDNCESCHMACAGFMPSAERVPGVLEITRSFVVTAVDAPPSHITKPPQHPPRSAT